jgi:hypothetical protein
MILATADMPTPPIPTKWTRPSEARVGVLVDSCGYRFQDKISHALIGVSNSKPVGIGCHGGEPGLIGDKRDELPGPIRA